MDWTLQDIAGATAAVLIVLVFRELLYRIMPPKDFRRRAPASALTSGRIVVTGWNTAEVQSILAAFAKLYDLDPSTFAVVETGEVVKVTWKRPITTDIALYLVNYLEYPADVSLAGRKAEAVGVIAVPADNAPKGVAAGTLAKISVPDGDTEHDVVCAQLADGRAYRISFTRMIWQSTDTPHATPLVAKVAFSEAA